MPTLVDGRFKVVVTGATGGVTAGVQAALADAQGAAVSAQSTAATIQALGNYRPTIAAALALTTEEGEAFTSDEGGTLLAYRRTGNSPFYERAPELDPVTKAQVTTLDTRVDALEAGGGTASALAPVVNRDGAPFIHSYQQPGTSAAGNLFMGEGSGNFNLSGGEGQAALLTGFGYLTLNSVTTATLNVAIGSRVLHSATTGSVNTGVGADALAGITTGGYNTAVGCKALANTETGFGNTAIGQASLMYDTTGSYNCAVGLHALNMNTTGNANVAAGFEALTANTAGERNVAIGNQSLRTNTASNNTAVGYRASHKNTTATLNVAVGYESAYETTTGEENVSVGASTLRLNTTGVGNAAFGYRALFYNGASYNVGVGNSALHQTTTGGGNVGVGHIALYGNTTGAGNVAVGERAGTGFYGANEQSSVDENCVFVGCRAARSLSVDQATSLNNMIVIGADARGTASNQVTLGNAAIDSLRCAVTSITALSDERDKADIEALGVGLPFIERLVETGAVAKFRWNTRDGARQTDTPEPGVIAQRLKAVQDEFGADWLGLVTEVGEDRMEATPGKLLFVALQAIAELSARVRELEAAR